MLMVLTAGFVALVLQTREVDLPDCTVFNEFQPCGHHTDYRIGLRVAIFVIGVLAAATTWWLARRSRPSVKRRTIG